MVTLSKNALLKPSLAYQKLIYDGFPQKIKKLIKIMTFFEKKILHS